jgi:hypothetical protein
LLLSPEVLDLGALAPGSEHEVEVAWRNPGGRALRRVGTRSGCGCVGWAGLPASFEGPGQGALGVVLRAPHVLGPVDARLWLVTDAPPPHDVVGVQVRAFVGQTLVVRPPAVDLGRRTLGARVPVRVEVHLPPACAGPVEAELEAWPGVACVVRAARHAQHGADVLLESALSGPAGTRIGVLQVRAAGAGAVSVPLRVVLEAPRAPTVAR